MFWLRKKYILLLDYYYTHAGIIDFLLALIIIFSTRIIFCYIPSNETLNDSTSSVIDNSVSLAGFILAALTIIVTFRASVMAKLSDAGTKQEREKIEEQMNGLEILLASNNYHTIAGAFKSTLIELIFTFALLGTVQLFRDIVPNYLRFYILLAGYIFTVLSITRALLILFKIMTVEKIQTTKVDE